MMPPSDRDQPLVDVLLAVFNAGATIREAIDSIRRQTVTRIRIIVIDDGSIDETPSILEDLARAEPRMLVLSKPNSGITDTLRVGLEHCRAPFIARHDADDLSEPDRFETELAYLDAHPDCVAVSGEARHIDGNGHPIGTIARMRAPDTANADWVPALEPYLIQPFLMMRRESLVAVGGYRPLSIAEDSDLYWRLQEVGRLHNISAILGSYRIHAGSVSSSSIRNGRINALCSQLAALSARRRRDGRPDLQFALSDAAAYHGAATLAEFHAIGCRQLDAKEQQRLRIAMAAKLIELCLYRPFEPDRADCRFIREAISDEGGIASVANRRILTETVMTLAVRLAGRGRVVNALLLLPWTRRPIMLARLAFRLGLPQPLRDRLKRSLGQA